MKIVVIAFLSALGVLAPMGYAQTVSTDTAVITACVSKFDGFTRIVSKAGSCVKEFETVVRWNQEGPAGPAGAQGPAGPMGLMGIPGPAGVAGPAGAMGLAGPAGVQGIAGPIGLQGATGPQGPAGPAGAQGPAGPMGVAGVAGPAGAMGVAGPAGMPGVAGPTGPQGATGPQGPAGLGLPHIITVPAGSDSTANGLALLAAVSSIPAGQAYLIMLDAGLYYFPNGNGPTLGENVSVKGAGVGLTTIQAAATFVHGVAESAGTPLTFNGTGPYLGGNVAVSDLTLYGMSLSISNVNFVYVNHVKVTNLVLTDSSGQIVDSTINDLIVLSPFSQGTSLVVSGSSLGYVSTATPNISYPTNAVACYGDYQVFSTVGTPTTIQTFNTVCQLPPQ